MSRSDLLSPDMDLEGISQRALRGIFSTKVLRDLARSGCSAAISLLISDLMKEKRASGVETLSDLYRACFFECARSQKSEYVYKNALVEKYLFGKHSLRTAAALFEVPVAGSKLDALLITDAMAAFEIKTERDELGRLAGQIEAYRRAFSKVWLFTCDRHMGAAEKLLPSEVGLAVLTSRYQIRVHRVAAGHEQQLDHSTMLRTLRQAELMEFSATHGGDTVPNTRVLSHALEIAKHLHPLEINDFVAGRLKARAISNAPLAAVLPRCLAASALALRLSLVQSRRLVETMEMPLERMLGR